ncbi:MAG: 50S ribosomal protein L9 [Candidatus Dormibacteria bacterium]
MTKVVLREDIARLGKRGDVRDVADGYARNYLLPKGKAIVFSEGNLAQAEAMRKARDLRDARERGDAETIARTLVPLVFAIQARAGAEGRLFGSVTSSDVAEAVAAQTGITLDRRRINLPEHIKALGTHEVPVRLHTDVEIFLTVEVVAG